MKAVSISRADLEELRRLSSSVLASSIERFRVRLPNTGFTHLSIRAMFEAPTMVGYAATLRIRTSEPPMEGRTYYKNTDWWDHVLSIPEPRVVVIEDLDHPRGCGAFVGVTHANLLRALGCVGLVTNGTVRDVDCLPSTGLQIFARGPSVSHAFAHVVEFGAKVTVAGMEVQAGDLIHGDRQGVQTVPLEIATQVPAVAQEIMKRRQHFLDLCRADNFSIEKFRQAIQETEDYRK
jgi:4-hydroxy-4-methyl-2-oxoglutarate aldolase